jgi:hypothetical protein
LAWATWAWAAARAAWAGTRIEREQQLAALDVVAVPEVDRLDIAADAGANVDLLGRLEAAGEVVPVDDPLLQRVGDGDGGRRRRAGGLALRAAIQRGRDHGGHSDDFQPAHARTLQRAI